MADEDQELYGEAEAGVTEEAQKPINIITKGFTAGKAQDNSPRASIIADQEVGKISVKDRLAKLQAMNNGSPPNIGPKPGVARKPQFVRKPADTSNNNETASTTPSRPPLGNKPARFTPSPKPFGNNNVQVPKLNDIKQRKQSLKIIEKKRDSQLPDSEQRSENTSPAKENNENVVITKDQKKYKKVPFVKKPGKSSKPATLNGVTLPIVHLTDVETGVESRIGGGRACIESEEFQIRSMTEEDELEESKPALPQSPHPPALARRKPLPPPPTSPEPASVVPTIDPTIEELYSEGQAEANIEDGDGQELYEEFDEGTTNLPSSTSTMNHIAARETPAADMRASPEPNRKLTKEEKKEKQKQEKLAKEREKQKIKEAKERDAFMKKHKISDEELTTSHYVEAASACSAGKGGMLALRAQERVQLIRKTNCPEGKWIVKNPHTLVVGLVDAGNMIDLEEEDLPESNGVEDIADGEDIYEELN